VVENSDETAVRLLLSDFSPIIDFGAITVQIYMAMILRSGLLGTNHMGC
jgi:hypothetical protein